MTIKISYNPSTKEYIWNFYTGPDGIDEFDGVATTLGECFEKIISCEAINSLHYTR